MTYAGIDADDIEDIEQALKDLNVVRTAQGATDADFTQKKVIAEGDIRGEITETTNAAGDVLEEAVEHSNRKLDTFSALTTLTALQWRHETTNLSKRLGELRDAPGAVGAWARIYGSESEAGKESVELKSTSVELGADRRVGDWIVGADFGYTEGDASFELGDADASSWSVGAYGTLITENGAFLDLTARYSRLETEFAAAVMEGKAKNDAFALSAEIGHRFELNKLAFVEPQAQLTYGRILGDKLTAANGVAIAQDDTDMLIGRIGARAGLNFPEKRGNLFLRISGAYDFLGETETAYAKGADRQVLKDDLGGAWMEYGFGANLFLTDRTTAYAELERTTGGDVAAKWRWNAGLRTVF